MTEAANPSAGDDQGVPAPSSPEAPAAIAGGEPAATPEPSTAEVSAAGSPSDASGGPIDEIATDAAAAAEIDAAAPAEPVAEVEAAQAPAGPVAEVEAAQAPAEPVAEVEAAQTPAEPVAEGEAAGAGATAEGTVPTSGELTYVQGDIVPAVVTAITGEGILAEIGAGIAGVVPKSELVVDLNVGDQLEGQILKRQAGSGRYVLSPKRAARERSWSRVLAAFEAGEILEGPVSGRTKGGLLVDLGVRAFLPDSLIDTRRPADPGKLIGTSVAVKVIECQRQGEKVVVDRRAVVSTQRAQAKKQLMAEIAVGERRRGVVSSLVPFGAFVDLGGAEGLIHVSELAHRQVSSPADVVQVGDEVDVVVLDVKTDKGKISLSRKAALPNPWQAMQAQHGVGDLVYGLVTSLAPFGAFVSIDGEGFEGIEGLVHISELSRFRVETPADVVAVGEGVWVKILAIEPEKRRLSLSLRRAVE